MNLPIEITRERPSEATDAFAKSMAGSSVFHGLAWARVLERGYGHDTAVFVARRGGAIVGLLFVVTQRQLGLGSKCVALPYQFDVGRPLTQEPDISATLLGAALAEARAIGARYLEIRVTGSCANTVAETLGDSSPDGFSLVDSGLIVTDIVLPKNNLQKTISRGIRREVGYAKNSGVVIRRTSDALALRRFRGLWLKEMKAHGAPQAGRSFFEAMLAEMPEALFLSEAWLGEKLIGGLLALGDSRVVYGRAVAGHTPIGRAHWVGKALTFDSVEWAQERGVQRYHLGITWTGDGGLKAYKDGWGGVTSTVRLLVAPVRGQAPTPGSYFGGFGLAKKVWSKLPLWLADGLGQQVTRWIG